MYFYLFITLLIFSLGEVVSVMTKARVSSVFVTLMIFLAGFLWRVFPGDIIDRAGLTQLGDWCTGFIVFHMGTMINVKQLAKEWRTVAVAMLSMLSAVVIILLVSPIVGKDVAIVSIPVINGGIVATNIMVNAAMEKGQALAAATAVIIYAVQKFFGTPFASHFGLKEGRRLVEIYRLKPLTVLEEGGGIQKKRKLYQRFDKYYGDYTCLFLTAFFAWLAYEIGRATGISYSIWALVLGTVAGETGIVPEKILNKANSSGLLNVAVFASIIPSLALVEPDQLLSLGLKVIIMFAALLIALYVVIGILPLWKLVKSKDLALGISVTQLLGFPATYLIAEEIASAVAETPEEREFVMEGIMPKFVVGGLATVTTLSVVMAGVFSNFL